MEIMELKNSINERKNALGAIKSRAYKMKELASLKIVT